MSEGAVSGNSSSGGGGVVVSGGIFTMSGGAVSGNSSSSSGGGVVVVGATIYRTLAMSGGSVSGNSSSHGGGVVVFYGTFTMSEGAVSGNSSSHGGGVLVDGGTFTMSGGAVSGNSSYLGGGVDIDSGTFIMSGGSVSNNILRTNGSGREVLLFPGGNGTFKISGDARPERVFLYDNARFITISGPLSGGTIPVDLGVTSSTPLTSWINKPILKLDTSYGSGNLASLKDYFTLGNTNLTESPYTETAITGYKISDGGLFVAE
jgi:hypothetical protein